MCGWEECLLSCGCLLHESKARIVPLMMQMLTGTGTWAGPEAIESQDRGPCVVAGSQPPCMCSAALRPDIVVPCGLSSPPYSGVVGLFPAC